MVVKVRKGFGFPKKRPFSQEYKNLIFSTSF